MPESKPCRCARCETTPANARHWVKHLTHQAEYAAELPPYERVVGLHQAQQALAAVLTARTSPAAQPLSGREVLMAAVIAAVKRHRSLVNSPHSVYATELAAASQRVDAALAALAAHDFDSGEVVNA